MKSKRLKYVSVLLMSFFVINIFVACGKKNVNELPKDYEADADVNPFLVEYEYITPEIAIDGVLDDDIWKDLTATSYSGDTTTTDAKAFYGKHGVYFGVTVSDPDLAKQGSVFQSSSIEIYLDTLNQDATTIDETQIGIHISAAGSIVTRMGASGDWKTATIDNDKAVSGNKTTTPIEYAVVADGTYNDKEKDKGYVVELFVPYALFGDNTDTEYGVGLATIECVKGIRAKQARLRGLTSKNPSTYWTLYRDTNAIEEYRKQNYALYQVDGKDKDVIWNNRTKYYFANRNVSVSNYFAKDGAYFFFEVKDDKVYADEATGSGESWDDCILLYLDPKINGGNAPQTDDAYLVVDAAGNIEFFRGNGTKWVSKSINDVFAGIQIQNGKLNGTAEGYSLEVFIPWQDLDMKTAPDSMGVNFAMRDWDGVVTNDIRVNTWYGTGHATAKPSEYIKMTKSLIAGSAPKAEITLDGKLNDKLWKSSELALLFGSSVKMHWAWADTGCYIAFDVTDSNVVTNVSETNPNMNSSIQVYLDNKGDGGKLGEGNLCLIADAAGRMLARRPKNGSYVGANSNAQVGAKLTQNGYIVEMYIPWVELDGTKPEQMGIAFGKNVYWNGETAKKWYTDEYCKNPNLPVLYSIFTPEAIKDTSDIIVYDASKLQGQVGFGAWSKGVCFKNLEITSSEGTKKYSLTNSEQSQLFDFYKKDEAKTNFVISANGLSSGTEANTSSFKKAILKEKLEVQTVSVDLYPIDGKLQGCLYLGVQGVVSGGVLSNPAVCFQVSDTNADGSGLSLNVCEYADDVTFKNVQINTLYSEKDAQPIRMCVKIEGTKATVILRSLTNTDRVETIEVDLNNY